MSQSSPPHPHQILRKKLYVIRSKRVAPQDEFMAVLPAHMDAQMQLERSGVLFAAGPMQAESGEREGMIIVRADSFDEARAIADQDPLHAKGVREYTLHEWSLNEGSFKLDIRLSDQNVGFD